MNKQNDKNTLVLESAAFANNFEIKFCKHVYVEKLLKEKMELSEQVEPNEGEWISLF
ncbi:hypothetical protein [uncultured Lactobacillus sp.]|uniref:hypothetical protein n=1 Tax=uncultured Lactobacillus sp. TaxID=153152 RepID=UPI0026111272|nr:hypothetical protein [uncultured Lactobacillus sp.]